MRRHRARTEDENRHYQAGASDMLVALFAAPVVMVHRELREAILQLAIELGMGVEVHTP